MKRCLLIVNPVAGKKKAVRHLGEIKRLLHDHGFVATVVLTRCRGDAVPIAAERANEFELVVCAGGDGTLNEVAYGLRLSGASCALGYIPSGSTNDFASSLSISKIPQEAIEGIASGRVRSLDMGSFNERPFAYVAACGAFTKCSYSAPQKRKNRWGHLAYLWEGVKEIPRIRSVHLKVELDGKCMEDDFIWASVSNSYSFGGVMHLRKEQVVLDDGKLEVMLIRKPKNLPRVVQSVLSGRFDAPEILLCTAEQVRFSTEKPMTWTLDGEAVENDGDVTVTCLPGALHLAM